MPSFFSKIFGDPNEKELNKLWLIVEEINKLETQFRSFGDGQFKEKTEELKKRLSDGETLDDILPEAFACVREASRRILGQRHYDVQLIGGMVLHQGKISEMKTGEGKTLAATGAVYLNALTGKGVHVVTVNDYLARRDANWMGAVYYFLGLSVSCVNHEKSFLYGPKIAPDDNEVTVEHENLRAVSRREAYAADITYGTNNEFGFDYLRDNMAHDLNSMVQRGFHFAIVDEVDSILIDEARTPLIISAPDMESENLYQQFSQIVPRLEKEKDYLVDEKFKNITLTDEGVERVEKILGMDIYNEGGIKLAHHLQQALRAHVFFQRDKDYVVRDGEVIIVDEFTGRLMPGRRYSEGLHQAIEAREGVKVQKESRTLATITFQNYFRMYEKLSGMTGTAVTSAEEFSKVYNLDVIIVPTGKPMIRQDKSDLIFRSEKGKFMAVANDIKRRHAAGQPVLVGTVSIEKNEYLSALLTKEGIPHEILNAKNHEREAQIIAQAGRKGAVTVATNMAGRGVDIILGGRPDTYESEEEWLKSHYEIVETGGLCVIGTERHEARRIDNQLRGRAGRQGDPGSSQFFVSLEDDLMRIFAPDKIKRMMETFNIPEDQPIESRIISHSIESAQEKIEGFHFDARKHVLEYDEVLNKQRTVIYRKRKEILEKEAETGAIISEMLKNEIGRIVDFHRESKDIGDIVKNIIGEKWESSLRGVLENADLIDGREEIKEKLANIAEEAYGEKRKEFGEDMPKVEKFILLRVIDMFWMNHLDEMGYLRESVKLRAYGHLDPLVEYKREGREYFDHLLIAIESSAINGIFKSAKAPEEKAERRTLNYNNRESSAPAGEPGIGRNDPCPCGATHPDGRPNKYKHCCGK